MKKTINNLLMIIFLFGLLIFILLNEERNNEIKNEIKTNGLYSLAVVKNKVASSGGTRRIDYSFIYLNKKYDWNSFTSRKFFKQSKVGDSIIIKFLSNNPKKSIIIESKKYSSCYLNYGKVWKAIPKCRN